MEAIKETIRNVLQSLSEKKQKPTLNPEELLKKVLTKKELGHIKFNYFRKGILSMNVDSSTWLYSLSLRKENLLVGLKEKLVDLKDIRFYIGETE